MRLACGQRRLFCVSHELERLTTTVPECSLGAPAVAIDRSLRLYIQIQRTIGLTCKECKKRIWTEA